MRRLHVRTTGLGPRALRTDRLARHLLRGFTVGDSMTEDDVAVFTARLHAAGHPEAGSALYRSLLLPADDWEGHVVDGAGHFVADDRPDAVVSHALALFGRVL